MPRRRGSRHHWYKPELHLRSKHSANILQSPVNVHPLCEERKRNDHRDGKIVSPVKKKLSPMGNKMHCSSFHTEMKYEGKFKYFKLSDGHREEKQGEKGAVGKEILKYGKIHL